MKKITYWVVILHLSIVTRLFAQQTIIEKSVPMKMGECMAQQISLVFENDVVYKVIDIEVPLDGNYMIDLATNASVTQKENLKIIIDDRKLADEIIISKKDAWVLGSMKNNKDGKESATFLTKGKHQIKLTFGNIEVPNTDEISIYRNGTTSKLSMNKYSEYIDNLKLNKLPPDYLSWKKKNKGARIAPNPKANYEHELDIAITYTYYETFYFNQGQQVTFETKNANTDPVMYLFNSSFGQTVVSNGSWANDDFNGLNSYLSVTIPTNGTYVLMVRAYGNWNPANNFGAGVCDIWKDGIVYKNSAPVSGRSFTGIPKPNQNINFFTGKNSSGSDSRILVSQGFTGKVDYQNDDYASSGNFSWGLSSRVKVSWFNSTATPFTQLLSYSISSIGTCDVYQNVLNSDVTTSFPNLKVDDAIQSAPATGGPSTVGGYNCGSWAGGITDFWFWPDGNFPQWVPANKNYLTAFDNFYGNNPARYSGAYTYTRSGADASNGAVALWANPNGPFDPNNPTKYTHASVTKPGNDNPHGYDWESKPGRLMRTFHPRDALNNLSFDGYGSIVAYYRYTGVNAARMVAGAKGGISLEESIKKGLSVMDKVEFEMEEKNKLNKSNQKIESKIADEFNRMLNDLENTPVSPELEKFSSYRIIYGSSKPYKALSEWCLKQRKSIYSLLISEYSADKPWMLLLADDVLVSQYPDVLESVKKENLKNPNDERGSYIVRTSEMNCMRFLKKLIKDIDGQSSTNSLGQNYPNEMDSQTTINFEIENDSELSINVYDDRGNLVKTLIDNTNQEAGKHTIIWDGKNNEGRKMSSGVYIYRLVTPKYSDSKRILIK